MELLREIKNLLETNDSVGGIFDLVAKTNLYKKIISQKIKKYSRFIKETRRYNLIIETTNLCNAKCIMCPYSVMKRKKEIMSDIIFDRIIERLRGEKINPVAVILNGFGDPLTDKTIFKRVKMLKNNFSKTVIKFYTNLNLADEKSINDILNCGLEEINISFNGATKQSYEKTMGINYEKTLTNLEKLISERNKSGSKLLIRISMASVRTNDKEERMFIKKWEKKVDSVSVNRVHTYGGAVADVSDKTINFNKNTFPCKYIWNTIVIGVKGDIFLCCLDYEGKYNFGNIREDRILDVFYSKAFEEMRVKHLKQEIKNIPICRKCYTPYRNGIEWLKRDVY